ncbi:MAG: tetratricopeptide repeat protein [Tepidisphaerales bacterium]
MSQTGAGDKLFSVLLVCYGGYPHYSCRAINSLTKTRNLRELCDVYVGCNTCCDETLRLVRRNVDEGLITTSIESGRNRHKDPMLRTMLEMVSTPYVLVMDDDCYVREGWAEAICEFARAEDPVDVAGAVYLWPRNQAYQRVAESRPWWRGLQYVPESQRQMIQFCTGGCFLARTAFLRENDYPDRGMVIQYEDTLLADLVYQVGGKLRAFPDSVLSRVVINDGKRRWAWEDGANDRDPGSRPAKPSPPPPRMPAEKREPVNIEAVLRSAVDLLRASRYQEAEAACGRVLAGDPEHAGALHLLGIVIHHTGRSSEAAQLIERAIARNPKLPDYHNSLGNVLDKLGRVDDAVAAFGRAIALKPDYAEGHNNLGNALVRLGRGDEAIAEYRTAIGVRPVYLEAQLNLGNALGKLGRSDEAITCFQKAAELAPRSPDVYSNLALLHQSRGQMREAVGFLDQAIQLNPKQAQARLNRALMLLASGNWEQGWEEYEWRWKLPENHAEHLRFRQPLWDGGDIVGRTILLHCEQGLGSTIQFIRYALVIVQRGARVVVECQAPLKAILAGLSPDVRVFAKGEVLPAFDVRLPLIDERATGAADHARHDSRRRPLFAGRRVSGEPVAGRVGEDRGVQGGHRLAGQHGLRRRWAAVDPSAPLRPVGPG